MIPAKPRQRVRALIPAMSSGCLITWSSLGAHTDRALPGCEDRCMLLHGFTSALGQCLKGVSRVYRRHFEGIALRELQARDAEGWAWVWEA